MGNFGLKSPKFSPNWAKFHENEAYLAQKVPISRNFCCMKAFQNLEKSLIFHDFVAIFLKIWAIYGKKCAKSLNFAQKCPIFAINLPFLGNFWQK